jgi:hypothetical protein
LGVDNYDQTSLVAPKNVLVLSGGGMNGAYTTGVLKGWTASGTRPQFDVVTGVSTGALIAPYAFLGSKYDEEVERFYTSIRREDIFRPRLLLVDSVASSEPLEQQISAAAKPEILSQIADAYRHGRRLYVGTTNLDTKQLVVWDMGAIAASDTPESKALFRRVLLASCSVPGLLPPVPIDVEVDGKHFTELHVDGGVTACAFLQPRMLGIASDGSFHPGPNPTVIRVIVAGKLDQNVTPAKRELFHIAGESMNAVLQAKTSSELREIFILSRYINADFKVAGIPHDFQTSEDSMSFAPQTMRTLFDMGYRGGKDGTIWQSLPPGLDAKWFSVPRSGTTLVATGSVPQTQWTLPERMNITLGTNVPAKENTVK